MLPLLVQVLRVQLDVVGPDPSNACVMQYAVVIIPFVKIEQSRLIARLQELDDFSLRAWADSEVHVALYHHIVRGADKGQPENYCEKCADIMHRKRLTAFAVQQIHTLVVVHPRDDAGVSVAAFTPLALGLRLSVNTGATAPPAD